MPRISSGPIALQSFAITVWQWLQRTTSGIDAHHGAIRFTWTLRAGDGKIVTEGIDFGELADDGRLSRITGFFGPPPVAAS